MSIITILFIIYSFILTTLFYFHHELDSFYISWLIEVLIYILYIGSLIYIYTLSHVVYRKKHHKLIKLINKLSNRIEDKNINYLSLFLSIVWTICITSLLVFYIFSIGEDVKNDAIFNGKESILVWKN
jgi:hypothetical protein